MRRQGVRGPEEPGEGDVVVAVHEAADQHEERPA